MKPTPDDHAEASARTVRHTTCTRCGRPILAARTPDRVGALDVRTDPTPIDALTEILARLNGRLTYCLVERPHTPARLRIRDRWHIAAGCTHPVLADHTCPPQPIQEALL